jgi:N6-adenosine-specific RNA methylase IME4
VKAHPAAELFPMLSPAELDELAADIRARGLLQPIVLHEGKILDGRNRFDACNRAGIAPTTVEWHAMPGVSPGDSPVSWVLSTNLHRRHLNESQRALIAAEALPLLEAEARERQKANLKRGTQSPAPVSAPGREREDDAAAPTPTPPGRKGKSSELAAKAVGASARQVERAKAVLTKRPELVDLIKAGKQTLKQAEKQIRKEEQLKNVLEYRPPVGTYAVIVADVPWEYDDQLDGSDQARGGTPYPPMPLDDILKIKPPAAGDCALWFWTTNAFLADGTAAQVVKAWGFEPKTVYTWRKVTKDGSKERLGSGHYGQNCTEHMILAVRGKPVVRGEGVPNIFDAPRGRHSEKPGRAFEVIEKVTPCAPGARIELFAVDERRPGWVTSGSEQQAKTRAKQPDAKARERSAPTDKDARYRCENCGQTLPEWKGKCPGCGTWGSVVEAALRGNSYRSITWQTKKATVVEKGGRFFITETGSHGLAPTWKTKPGDELDLAGKEAHELVRASSDGFGRVPKGFAAAVAAARAKGAKDAEKKPELIIRWGKRQSGKVVQVGKGLSGLTYKIEKGSATIGGKFSLLTQFPGQVKAGGASIYGSFSAVNPEGAPHAPLLSVAHCLELADALEARELKKRAKQAKSAAPKTGEKYRKLEWHPRRPNSEIVAVAKGRSGRRYAIKRGGSKDWPHFDMTYEALQGSRLGAGPGGHHLLDSIEKAKASADQHERRELGLDS